MQFEGKTIWVTGGRSGIGRAIAAQFSERGANVVLSGRDEDGLAETARELGSLVTPMACDVSDAGQVEKTARAITDRFGSIDVLVNNAGSTVFKSFMATSIEEFDELAATNLRGPFLCSRAVLPGMLEQNEGAIVMINSMAALNVFPDSSVYSATKGGLKMLADCLRFEVRTSGVRVISIFPGATNTAIWPERLREKHSAKMMSPEDVARAVMTACEAPAGVLFEDIVMQPIGGGI